MSVAAAHGLQLLISGKLPDTKARRITLVVLYQVDDFLQAVPVRLDCEVGFTYLGDVQQKGAPSGIGSQRSVRRVVRGSCCLFEKTPKLHTKAVGFLVLSASYS